MVEQRLDALVAGKVTSVERAALDRACLEERRTVSSVVRWLIVQWLVDSGYLREGGGGG